MRQTDFEKICSFENLHKAHKNAKKGRGRGNKREVILFEMNLAYHLAQLQDEIKSKSYKMKGYYNFQVHEPKTRNIYAARHIDKIVMHMLCDEILIPRLEPHFIYDNAACQKDKGTHFALRRFTKFLTESFKKHGQNVYVLKCDIRRYFDSIDHEVLKNQIKKKIPDQDALDLLNHYIDSYHAKDTPGIGIPLGNQTSQWFALFYLSGLDHFIKEKLKIRGYIRYMDDFVLIHHDKKVLWNALEEIKKIVNDDLKLQLNPKTDIFKVSRGVEFLGWRFFVNTDGKIVKRLKLQSKKRYKKKLKFLQKAYSKGEIDFEDVRRSLASYAGHLKHGNTHSLQRKFMHEFSLELDSIDENQKNPRHM